MLSDLCKCCLQQWHYYQFQACLFMCVQEIWAQTVTLEHQRLYISPALSFLTLEPVVCAKDSAMEKSHLHCLNGHWFSSRKFIFNAYYSFSWERYNDVGSDELGFTFSMIKHTHRRSVLIWFLHVCNQFSVLLGSANPPYDSPCVQCGTFSLQTVGTTREPLENYISSNVHVFMLTQKVLQLEVRVRREPLWVNSDSTRVALMTRVNGLCWLFPDCCLYQSHNWLKSPLHLNLSRQVVFNREWYGFMVNLCDWFHWVV